MHEGYLARKLGLGTANPRAVDISAEDYVDEQLSMPIIDLALKDNIGMVTTKIIEPWPQKFDISLTEIWNDISQYRRREEQIRSSNRALSSSQLENLEILQDSLKWYHREAEAYRFAMTNLYSNHHVLNRLNLFWYNHFSVSGVDYIGDYLISIGQKLDGKFNDLLYHCTSHVAMTDYLDNSSNIGLNSRLVKQCRPDGVEECINGMNDNLARELLELHTVSPARAYDEKDINEAAKVLTGWGRYQPGNSHRWRPSKGENWFRDAHEPGGKTVLGHRIPGGQKGLRVLTDHLARDPMTIQHVSKKLLRHFCGDPIDNDDLDAVVKVWNDTGGHLPAVHREVLIRAAYKPNQKFLWPLIWAFQVMRVTGGHPFPGVDNVFYGFEEKLTRVFPKGPLLPRSLYIELGMDIFVSPQTPDGFSEEKSDWVSNEHMDRRLKFSEFVFKRAKNDAAKSKLTPDEIAARQRFSSKTIQVASSFNNDETFYQLLMCSPEMMEV